MKVYYTMKVQTPRLVPLLKQLRSQASIALAGWRGSGFEFKSLCQPRKGGGGGQPSHCLQKIALQGSEIAKLLKCCSNSQSYWKICVLSLFFPRKLLTEKTQQNICILCKRIQLFLLLEPRVMNTAGEVSTRECTIRHSKFCQHISGIC